MQGCELVIHTASPFFITGIKNPETKLIKPALEGTRNVLSSASKTPSVIPIEQSIKECFQKILDDRLLDK
jgi:hypothetical protein